MQRDPDERNLKQEDLHRSPWERPAKPQRRQSPPPKPARPQLAKQDPNTISVVLPPELRATWDRIGGQRWLVTVLAMKAAAAADKAAKAAQDAAAKNKPA